MIYILSFCLVCVSLVLFWQFLQNYKKKEKDLLKESFRSLSHEVMEENSRIFLELAKNSLEKYQEKAETDLEVRQKAIDALFQPVQETMKKLDQHQRELEKERALAYGSLIKQIDSLVQAEKDLRKETVQLSQSLKVPHIRGSWGEIQLKRVVELAGLVNYCDFIEQKTVDFSGRIQRPDLIVKLPGQREIVIDSKAPLGVYFEANTATDEETKQKKLQELAAVLRKHVKDLSSKEYYKQLQQSPEYVILFLPTEAVFSAALQIDPSLIELGADQNVILATPTTLIAILRAVSYSWKQENLSKSAKEISSIGHDLYERIGVFCEHWNRVGKSLNQAVDSFNQSASSLESRVFVSMRKLKESAEIQKELPEKNLIDRVARSLELS